MAVSQTRPVLLVLDDWGGYLAASPAAPHLAANAEVTFLDCPLSEAPPELLARAQVILAIRERTGLDAAILDRMPALELILQTGGHAYHLDAAHALDRGIVVALGRRARSGQAAVPELTFALMIAALRRFPEAMRAMDAGEWPTLVGRTLGGRRLGVVGMGRYGSRVTAIAEAFGMDVVAWARKPGRPAGGPPRVSLDELVRTSDVVTIHLRLSQESRHLFDARRLAMMKPGAVLVNTARGAIVDEAALVGALRNGPLAAAGLDVFTEEPLPPRHPLRSLPNVVLTPHLGWTVEETFAEFARVASEQLADYLAHRLSRDELLDPSVRAGGPSRSGGVLPSAHAVS